MHRVALPGSTVAVCHVPVRSESQFIVKVAVKRLARVAAGRDYPPASRIWRAWKAICHGDRLTPAQMLTSHLVGHHSSAEISLDDRFATVDDPFLADIALRYTAASASATDPLPLVLSAVEGLARKLAAAGSQPGAGAAPSPRN